MEIKIELVRKAFVRAILAHEPLVDRVLLALVTLQPVLVVGLVVTLVTMDILDGSGTERQKYLLIDPVLCQCICLLVLGVVQLSMELQSVLALEVLAATVAE